MLPPIHHPDHVLRSHNPDLAAQVTDLTEQTLAIGAA